MKNTKKKAVLQEYKTLEDIKQEFLDEYKQNDVLYQKDVMDAVEHLAMTDTDFDDLFQWFSDNDIEVKNEDDDVDLMDDDALVATEDDDDIDFLDDDTDALSFWIRKRSRKLRGAFRQVMKRQRKS